MKRCPRCEETLADEAFRVCKNGTLSAYCKVCQAAYNREYRQAHKEAHCGYNRKYYQRLKTAPLAERTANTDCPRCHRPGLTADDFYWQPTNKRASYCKACHGAVCQAWTKVNRKARQAISKRYYHRRKLRRLRERVKA